MQICYQKLSKYPRHTMHICTSQGNDNTPSFHLIKIDILFVILNKLDLNNNVKKYLEEWKHNTSKVNPNRRNNEDNDASDNM